MVFTYKCPTEGYEVYMGRDKYENEDLIAFAFPEDVWFHVSELSSAHVYVRMPFGHTDWESLPVEVVRDACQLTKHNSIEGSKQSEVTIVYTPASNLKKKQSMETGQVGFKDHTKVKYVQHVKRDKELLKKLEKTKTEANINLEEMKIQRDRREREQRKKQLQQQKLQQEKEEKERQQLLDLKTYKSLTSLTPAMDYKGDGTIDSCRQIEEDFL